MQRFEKKNSLPGTLTAERHVAELPSGAHFHRVAPRSASGAVRVATVVLSGGHRVLGELIVEQGLGRLRARGRPRLAGQAGVGHVQGPLVLRAQGGQLARRRSYTQRSLQ